jgi:hypothetical protein
VSLEKALVIGAVSFVLFLLTALYIKKMPKIVKRGYFTARWRELQMLCGDKQTWPDALIRADELFDEVLRKRKFSGNTIGERMVSAQKAFTNNDTIWAAHKFVNKISDNRELKIKESDVKDSLVAYRQAMRDLGAL